MPLIIDGKATAAELRQQLAQEVTSMRDTAARAPGLAVILVGEDPASAVYVRNKARACAEAGIESEVIRLDAQTEQSALADEVARLNADPSVDGILVQLPLPDHIDSEAIVQSINSRKDVDGFTYENSGRLFMGDSQCLAPCTPTGCMMLIKQALGDSLSGLNAVVVGRSQIVGLPMSALLTHNHCTVTVAHSRTRDLPELCATADILVAAVGRPEMIKGDWVKPGATVIDVGINRIGTADGTSRLVGDVDYVGASAVAGAITPVPGGVGPMTIACLLQNTVTAFRRSQV